MAFDAQAYGDVFAELISEKRLNPLDGGVENSAAESQLKALNIESAFAGKNVVDQDMADACISGAWLYHNFLDASHTISQGIQTHTGSFWHGIMHRREPDFSNSKYWFRNVGDHSLFDAINKEAQGIAQTAGDAPDFLISQTAWDPYAFVDLCADALSGKSSADALCREIQQREWELLFDFSYRHAVGE
ncbi:MAG: hypothetical protein HOE48_21835 [Candidatus Latescibacteria bacterium]|jgi:hypothetical protein|nr:hypothetical protein [Candidatus Latescibacterota bacterium]MBT4140567.1 hypothetical protein [Candidatus Latescibacterota bacterium]MBT5829490.1 hypothetical protein [Candidatus Latescibacterota bacterium]